MPHYSPAQDGSPKSITLRAVPAMSIKKKEDTKGVPGFGPSRALRRMISLLGPYFELNAVVEPTTVIVTQPGTVKLAWTLPAATTSITIGVDYNAEIDLEGFRPKATIESNMTLGIEDSLTVIAPAGAGSRSIVLSFDALPVAGTLIINLIVPESGTNVNVTWSPQIQSGQGGAFGGTPITVLSVGGDSSGRGDSRTTGTGFTRNTGNR